MNNSGQTINISLDKFSELCSENNDRKNIDWTADINRELPIKLESTGLASQIMP